MSISLVNCTMIFYGHEMPCVIPLPTTYNLDHEWQVFQESYGKNYPTTEEAEWRKKIFQYTLVRIEEHNARIAAIQDGESHGWMGITPTSDYTMEEHMMRHPSYVPMPENATLLGVSELETILEEAREFSFRAHGEEGVDPLIKDTQGRPSANRRTDIFLSHRPALDWREDGYVSQVSDQGLCGGCWAFAATAVIEAHFYRISGMANKFSAQYLLDCSLSNNRCVSGSAMQALEFVRTRGHVPETWSNTFKCGIPQSRACRQSTCSTSDSPNHIMPGHNYTPLWIAGTMDAIMTALQLGPLVVHLDGSSESFRSHTGGILREYQCSRHNIGHTMVLIGYGSDNGVDYWRIKNSWGTDWGDNGFIKLHKGPGINTCGVLSQIIAVRVDSLLTSHR